MWNVSTLRCMYCLAPWLMAPAEAAGPRSVHRMCVQRLRLCSTWRSAHCVLPAAVCLTCKALARNTVEHALVLALIWWRLLVHAVLDSLCGCRQTRRKTLTSLLRLESDTWLPPACLPAMSLSCFALCTASTATWMARAWTASAIVLSRTLQKCWLKASASSACLDAAAAACWVASSAMLLY